VKKLEINKQKFPAVPDRRYFTIGEAAKLACSKPHTLRYWEREAPVLDNVERRGNRRYYTRDNVLRLQRVNYLLAEGNTLAGVNRALQQTPSKQSLAWLRDELREVISIL
jgi:DNA-binding transcriptional MerR regulator